MLGAIIGDLAARTYKENRELFYSELFSEQADFSVYGHALLKAMSRNVLSDRSIDVSPIGSPYKLQYRGQWLMWQIMDAWNMIELKDMPQFYSIDKDEQYARMFVLEIIRSLRSGKSKRETFLTVQSFENMFNNWDWRNPKESEKLTTFVFRAWECFSKGFDFTSSIHNAMKCSGDKHLMGALTGAFASAMYGCRHSFIKKKYAADNKTTIELLGKVEVAIENYYHYALGRECDKEGEYRRAFFPKNYSLTNVEWHHFTPVENPFGELLFTDAQYRRILRSSPTGWECRYGLYLDDGWMYIYRSGYLLGRFRLERFGEDWKITSLQHSGEQSYGILCVGLSCALIEGCDLKGFRCLEEIQETYLNL